MKDEYGLPMLLEDNLVLRWAKATDAEALAAFNVAQHSDNPDEPEVFLGHWTKDLMTGVHPSVRPSDFTVVIDKSGGDAIISTAALISQRWAYDGIAFGCGRPELIATDAAYRKRGLVRRQMDILHAKSAVRGELVQAITGIPWFYRKFGYDMALNLGGGRAFLWSRPGNDVAVEAEKYHLREANIGDIPELMELYPIHCGDSLITSVRSESYRRYELKDAHRDSDYARHIRMIMEGDCTVGYVEFRQWSERWFVREFAVKLGHSWREVALFLTRSLKERASERNEKLSKPISSVFFALGSRHRLYEALGDQLQPLSPPYAWYIRVPDLPAFLGHIEPVIERRLSRSVMARHTGILKLNFYTSNLAIAFEGGKLKSISSFEPSGMAEGDAVFPDLTFLQLLFGYRSVEELTDSRADCFTRGAESRILLNILFPKRPSSPIGLG